MQRVNHVVDPNDSNLKIAGKVAIPLDEITLTAIRAGGPGGQNVNKVSTAVHLRFDIKASSLPTSYKERLMGLHDQRVSLDGVIVIKAQKYRTQEQNRQDALYRLQELIKSAVAMRKLRKPTKPTRGSQKRRLESKTRHGQKKVLRGKVEY